MSRKSVIVGNRMWTIMMFLWSYKISFTRCWYILSLIFNMSTHKREGGCSVSFLCLTKYIILRNQLSIRFEKVRKIPHILHIRYFIIWTYTVLTINLTDLEDCNWWYGSLCRIHNINSWFCIPRKRVQSSFKNRLSYMISEPNGQGKED